NHRHVLPAFHPLENSGQPRMKFTDAIDKLDELREQAELLHGKIAARQQFIDRLSGDQINTVKFFFRQQLIQPLEIFLGPHPDASWLEIIGAFRTSFVAALLESISKLKRESEPLFRQIEQIENSGVIDV
ncbi:MAG TPA: hypothetical protein VGI40_01695, partial [Pirellulaceae bacterium]